MRNTAMDEAEILKQDFIEESLPLVDEIEASLLSLEQDSLERLGKITCLRGIQSPLHTLKGNSGMMGFQHIQTLAHHAEDAVRAASENPESMDASFFSAMYKVVDYLRRMVEEVESNKKGRPLNVDGLLEELSEFSEF
jgi:two-component system chemotaxis sensor kinase CheA